MTKRRDARTVHVLLPDPFADWEPSLLLCELARLGGWTVVTVGIDGREIRSMGGLRVTTDTVIAEVDPAGVSTVVVIGSPRWEQAPIPAVSAFLRAAAQGGALVAAICGGTLAAGHAGLLQERRYTSNDPDFVAKLVGAARVGTYVDAAAVRDGQVITAGGLGYVELAAEVLVAIGAMPAAAKDGWVGFLRTPPGAATGAGAAA